MMNTKLLQSCTFLSVLVLVPVAGFALPQNGVVNSGAATIDNSVIHQTTINQSSDKAIISWDSFNISTGEKTTFNQPGANSVTLNRIGDANPTRIFGQLTANGNIMLINKNGFQFGPTSQVDVGGMIATTSNITDANFNNSTGNYKFNQPATDRLHATITVNNGAQIKTAADGGIIALVAPNVVNQGTITAHMGKVSLAGGQAFTIDLMGDGLVNLQVPTTNTDANVTNASTGKIITDGGTVQLSAKTASSVVDSVINMDGIIQAETVSGHDGRIVLDANKAIEAATLHTDTDTVELKNDKLKVDKDGIALVNTHGTVKLGKGTFTTDHTIQVNKTVTVQGSGSGNTTIDTSGTPDGAFGIHVTADNAEIRALNVKSGTNNQNAIKVEGDYTTRTKVEGVKIVNVTVDGHSKKAEIDLNGADGAVVRNVTVNGNGTAGVGIAVTDSNRVTLQDVNTTGNAWGGIGIYTSGNSFAGGVDKLKVIGTNTFGEANQMYTEENNGYQVTRLTTPGFDYLIQSTALNSVHQKLYQMSQGSAVNEALNVGGDATIQGLDEATGWTAGNNTWLVGRDATRQMDLQSSFNAVQDNGTLTILAGNYDYNSTLYVDNDGVKVQGVGRDLVTLTDHGVDYGMDINGDNVTLQGFTLQSANAATTYGLKIEPDTLASANPAADDSDGHMEDPRYQDTVSGLTLFDLKVAGFGKNEIDLNSARNVLINDVIADGQGTAGYGIAMTDSRNITLNDVHTTGNNWGGVYIDARGKYYVGGVDNVQFWGTNSFAEAAQLTTQVENGNTITHLYAPDFNFVARSAAAVGISIYQQSLQPAVQVALGLGGANSTVEGLKEDPTAWTIGDNHFYVGETSADGSHEMSVQAAVDAVQEGGVVSVLDGTYHLNNSPYGYLRITKGLTLSGNGEAQTTLDGSQNSTYGIRVIADNATLENFTLNGPAKQAAGSSQEYGIKVEADPAINGATVDNLVIGNVTVQGAGKTQIDVNSGNNLSFSNLTLTGNGTRGAGLFLTDDSNVQISNIHTSNNAWGGVALSANHGDMSNIYFTGSNSYGEAIQMYTEGANGHVVKNIYAPEFDYVTQVNGVLGFGSYYTALTPAITRSLALSTANGTVQGLRETGGWTVGNNHYYVGQQAGNEMSIQAAADAARAGGLISVQDGTYHLNTYPNHYLYLTKGVTLAGNGQGNTTLDGSANSSYGIRVQADNVTLSDFTLIGPHSQPAGSSQEYGIKAELGASTGATLDNLVLNNLTVKNAGKTQVDVNTGKNLAFNNLNLIGNGVRGAGLFLTDDNNVVINDVDTDNNAWGGIALSANQMNMKNILFTGGNSYTNETIEMYTEGANGHTVSNIYAPEFNYVTAVNGVLGYGAYYTALTPAIEQSLVLSTANGTVQGLNTPFLGFTKGNNNWYVGETAADGSREMSVQAAATAASSGGNIHIQDGTYHLNTYPNGYLALLKRLNVSGNGQANTTLDGSANSTYGIRVEADNVTLADFTLIGPHSQPAGSSQEYGVKAEVVDTALSGPTIDHFTMNNVTVKNAGKTQIDVNAATFTAFNNVTAIGNGVRGNGFGITNANDVTFNGVTTSDNGWGGIRITANDGGLSTKIRLLGTNSLGEDNPFYTEAVGSGQVTAMYLPGLNYFVHSATYDALAGAVTNFYNQTENGGLVIADRVVTEGGADATMQGVGYDAQYHVMGNNQFYVDNQMDIQTAVNEALTGGLIHLYNATYDVPTPLQLGGKDIAFKGTGTQPVADGGTVMDASTLDHAFDNGTGTYSDLTLLLKQPGEGGGDGGDGGDNGGGDNGAGNPNDGGPDDVITRETTRRNSGFVAGNGGIGGGNAFDIEPAAGDEKDKKAKKDIADSPLQQEDLAVAQYFINTGDVVAQQDAVQALLADAALNGQ